MLFNQIIGQEHIKNHLKVSAENGRIPHAQLFVGKEGSGTLPMAIAYAQFLLCHFSDNVEICDLKCEKLQHPDLHFAFPVTSNEKVKKHPVSSLFLQEWRTFVATQPYGNLFNWLQHIGVEKKQGIIGVDEAEEIVKKLTLKSYEGGFKVMIIWMAEKMNIAAANKLLKLIEEPPQKTVFLLITENEEQLINTIKSRCQALHFPALSEQDISNALIVNHQISDNEASKIAHQAEGNFNKAFKRISLVPIDYKTNKATLDDYVSKLDSLGLINLESRCITPFPLLSLPNSLQSKYINLINKNLDLWRNFNSSDKPWKRYFGMGYMIFGIKSS